MLKVLVVLVSVGVFVASGFGGAPVCAQDAGALAERPDAPLSSLEAWKLPELELPRGITREVGRPAESVQLSTFLSMPTMSGLLPAPSASFEQVWSTQREGQPAARGGYVVLHYSGGVPDDVRGFLPANLWGRDGGPTERHPEDVAFTDEFVVLTSFAADDPTGDVLRVALREAGGPALPRTWPAVRGVLAEMLSAYLGSDPALVLATFDEHAEALADHAMAQFMAAEAASQLRDSERAEPLYVRALSLHDSGRDVLGVAGDSSLLWTALDGLGVALIIQRKDTEVIPVLQRAVAVAQEAGVDFAAATSAYNLACSLSMTARFEESAQALMLCLAVEPAYMEQARRDSDFKLAWEDEDFQRVLDL
ncbi:MAG: hypothetical protein DHS20C15_30820 [Planctomycetota bacterium]|nr:MAG: hypothetical protein DHS20C15_30820 [Planctomycetota bacterium]